MPTIPNSEDSQQGMVAGPERNKVAPKPNSPTRSMVQNAFDRGWDPTRIWNGETQQYDGSVLPWDRATETFDRNLQNRDSIPGGVPAHDQAKDTSGGPVLEQSVTWNTPGTSNQRGNLKPTSDLTGDSRMSGAPEWNRPERDGGRPTISS